MSQLLYVCSLNLYESGCNERFKLQLFALYTVRKCI